MITLQSQSISLKLNSSKLEFDKKTNMRSPTWPSLTVLVLLFNIQSVVTQSAQPTGFKKEMILHVVAREILKHIIEFILLFYFNCP